MSLLAETMTAHSSPDIDELSAHSAEDQHSEPSPLTNDNDPPSYPTDSTPAYTPRPEAGAEQTVVRGPPVASELTGSVEYSAKRFRVTFGGQPVGRTVAQGPEYAKGSKVRGVVRLDDKWRDKVGCVELKVGGVDRTVDQLVIDIGCGGYVGPGYDQALDTRFRLDEYNFFGSYRSTSSRPVVKRHTCSAVSRRVTIQVGASVDVR